VGLHHSNRIGRAPGASSQDRAKEEHNKDSSEKQPSAPQENTGKADCEVKKAFLHGAWPRPYQDVTVGGDLGRLNPRTVYEGIFRNECGKYTLPDTSKTPDADQNIAKSLRYVRRIT